MANRNPKNVKRFIENISKEAAKIVYEGGGSGGGTIVVNELPETGEAHTIYELHQDKPAVYGWMFCYGRTPDPNFNQFLVFDTYEQMTSTINAIKIGKNTKDIDYYAYIRNTNQMYYFCVEYPEEPEEPYWIFEEQQKKEDESGTDYAFQLGTLEDYQTFYILKEFVGNIISIPDGGWQVSYLTLDNKEVYVGYEGFGVLLRNIVYPNKLDYFVNDFIGDLPNAVLDHLPTSTEAEELFYNQLKYNRGDILLYNTSDGKYYYISNDDVDYYWEVTDEQTLDGYFAQNAESEGEPPHYNGPLVWVEDSDVDELPVFNEIPYEQIINTDPNNMLDWRFIPNQAGEVTSYWIYANDEWVNVDEIPDPNLIKIGITCTNGNWNVATLSLDSIIVTYDDVDYKVTQYAEIEEATEWGAIVTYYGYIEVPMPTQDNLTHTISVSTSERSDNWFFDVLKDTGNVLNRDSATIDGISLIYIYYQILN